jgi:hypothetical protein
MAGMYRLPFGASSLPWAAAAGPPASWIRPGIAIPRGYVQSVGEGVGMQIPGRPEMVRLSGARGVGHLARLSAVGQATDGGKVSTGAYATASLIGAAAGGAIIGYLSSADPEGAVTGGLFTTGLAGLSDAFLFAREGEGGAMLPMFAIGIGTLGWSLFRFSRALQAGGGGGPAYR